MAEAAAPARRRKRGIVPRPIRRALLLFAFLAASTLLGAEIVVSVRHVLG